MSRIGRMPVPVPNGVKCEVSGNRIKVAGPNGVLERTFPLRMTVSFADGVLTVTRPSDHPDDRAAHGLTRALVNNMVLGVTQGFEKTLVIEGVGYRASLQGSSLNLALGYSHPVVVNPPDGISFEVSTPQTIKVSGIDKEKVGQTAADIRALRKPEPYKGKGIRLSTERVRRKVGKSGSK